MADANMNTMVLVWWRYMEYISLEQNHLTEYSASSVMVDEQIPLYGRYIRYCYKTGTIVFSIQNTIE